MVISNVVTNVGGTDSIGSGDDGSGRNSTCSGSYNNYYASSDYVEVVVLVVLVLIVMM